MTVSYQSDVASSTSGGLIRLLWRWRGSVWKLVYRELLIFQLAFIGLALSYRFLLTGVYKEIYHYIVIVCSGFVDMIPLSFILGFYVSFTASRWWNQYNAIPWPDKLMNNIALYVPGNDEVSRMLRRTLMRYANLSLVLVLRSISIAVKRRFPTKEHLIEAGFMNKTELDMYSSVPSTEFNTFWIPCTWFVNLLREARQDCRITDSSGLKLIMEEFNEFRNKCGLLWSYDWVSIPLVYTQVVTVATYSFFIASVFGRQYIDRPYPSVFKEDFEHKGEFLIPVFSIIQFLLYMGLLKLGEQLINPFGDDDEDFELNWIIDRHIKVSFLGVDILNTRAPPLCKDNYFDETDIKLPYTEAAVSYKKKTYRGSMAAYHVPSEQQGLVVPEFDEDNEEDDFFNSTLHSAGSQKGQSSLWSVFGKGSKEKSASLISLDSDTFEQQLNQWQGSQASFGATQVHVQPPLQLHSYEEQVLEDEFMEADLNILEPVCATQNLIGISKESSQESTEKPQTYRKPSDTPSTASHSLKIAASQRGSRTSCGGLSTTPDMSISTLPSKFDSKKQTQRKGSAPQKNQLTVAGATGPIGKSTKLPSLPPLVSALGKASKGGAYRKADPKLRIKPFKSKVTFSDQPVYTQLSATATPVNEASRAAAELSRQVAAVVSIVNENVDDTISLGQYRALLSMPHLLPTQMPNMDLTISSPELSEAHLLNTYLQGEPAPVAEFGLPLDARLAGALGKHRASTVGIAGELGHAAVRLPGHLIHSGLAGPLISKLAAIDANRTVFGEKEAPSRTVPTSGLQTTASVEQISTSHLSAQPSKLQTIRSASSGSIARRPLQIGTSNVPISKTSALRGEIPITRLARPADCGRRQSVQMSSQGVVGTAGNLPIGVTAATSVAAGGQAGQMSQNQEYWLKHQSLPNIQELVEETGSEPASSPVRKDAPHILPLYAISNKELTTKPSAQSERTPEDRLSVCDPRSMTTPGSSAETAQERRQLFSKSTLTGSGSGGGGGCGTNSSTSSGSSSTAAQRYSSRRSKIKSSASNSLGSSSKQSSTESEGSGFFTARSKHEPIAEVEPTGSVDSSLSDVLYDSAKELLPYATVRLEGQEISDELGEVVIESSDHDQLSQIPTIVVMSTSPATSQYDLSATTLGTTSRYPTDLRRQDEISEENKDEDGRSHRSSSLQHPTQSQHSSRSPSQQIEPPPSSSQQQRPTH